MSVRVIVPKQLIFATIAYFQLVVYQLPARSDLWSSSEYSLLLYCMCTSHTAKRCDVHLAYLTILNFAEVRNALDVNENPLQEPVMVHSDTKDVVCTLHTLLYSVNSRMLFLHTSLYSILVRSGMLLMSIRTLSKGQSWYTPAPVLPAITLNSSGCLAYSDSSSNSSGRDVGAR